MALARALAKGPQLKNLAKSLMFAAITGVVLIVPSTTATAEPHDPATPGPAPVQQQAPSQTSSQQQAPSHQAQSVNWDAIAACETGGNWGTDTGNGFAGGLQFTPDTWAANGGSGSAANASRVEQIRVAESVLRTQGIGAWPTCGPRG